MICDLNLYKTFYTVCKCKNISKAAELLYVSQPAVSKSIKILEENLNTTLFIRSSKGVSLTLEGELFFSYINKGLEEFSKGENLLDKIKNKEVGNIKIGVSTTIGKNYLIPKLEMFAKFYPSFKISIMNKPTVDTIESVKDGKLDIAIVSPHEKDKELEFLELSTMQDIFVASPDYLDKVDYSSTEELFGKGSLMLLENNNITREHINNYFTAIGIDITPDIEASNMEFLIECAKIGLGITSVVKEFVYGYLEDGTLVELHLNKPISPRTIEIVYKDSSYMSIATKTLIDFLRENSILREYIWIKG